MSRKTVVIMCAIAFLLSTFFFWQNQSKEMLPTLKIGGEELGKLCVSEVYPTITKGEKKEKPQQTAKAEEPKAAKEEIKTKPTEKKEKKKKKADNSKPTVIIYHTHGSESYQPYSESNFHTVKEKGSVREVGNVLSEELQDLGIGVVHDKSIHDRPSYNQSYDRSMETIQGLMKKYPTAKYIIDLHRDAAAYSGNVGKTLKIGDETVAKYDLVIGQNNDNYSKLMAYAKQVNNKAESLYPGFGGKIIAKTYRFNEYIADNYLLL